MTRQKAIAIFIVLFLLVLGFYAYYLHNKQHNSNTASNTVTQSSSNSASTDLLGKLPQPADVKNTSSELKDAFNKKISYTLNDIKINNDDSTRATATAVIVMPDLNGILRQAVEQAVESESKNDSYEKTLQTARNNLMNVLSSTNCPTINKTVDVQLVSVDGNWKIIEDSNVDSVMYGDINQIISSLYK